jgi:[1-hydroxy-2-(trimethylamino)ethyl]phosphonate dioxygenase
MPVPVKRKPETDEILALFQQRGASQYGGEAVTQLEHALQAATFAERDGAAPALITAALIHDVGHLLHDLPDDAPDKGLDDRHETLAAAWLAVAPVAMHVAAKRYLCAVESAYMGQLSPPSVQSLALQGGPMSREEVDRFRKRPYFQDALRLRRWDDAAKVVGMKTEGLEHFAHCLDLAVEADA